MQFPQEKQKSKTALARSSALHLERCGICNFLRNNKKVGLPWHVAQLHIWKGGIGTLDTDTQLNSTKIKQIQSLLNPTNVL